MTTTVSLRRLVDVIDCAHVTAPFVDDDRRFPVASIRECQGAYVDLSDCKYTTQEFFDHLRASDRAPRTGDLLFIRNVSVGLVSAVAPGTPEFAVGQETVLLRRTSEVDPTFLRYALVGAEANYAVESAMIGSTFRRINVSAIRALPVALPPPEEQRLIANYLDRETAHIDTLIEEQQRLIEMLDERRDGVIAEAATKGVSPGVALVDSGVEWLGDIPEGWSVKALRRCGTLLTGATPPTDNRSNFAEEENERPWVRPQDLSSETRASAWLTADGWSKMRPVPAGSVLVGCIAYSLGSVGYLPVAATTNQQITCIIPAEEGRYLYYVMRAAKSELWAASQMNRVPILNNQRLGAIQVPVPPVEEQRLIAAYLDEQTEKIDRTKAEAERFIKLARERRSALITAAVTGQIDVREGRDG